MFAQNSRKPDTFLVGDTSAANAGPVDAVDFGVSAEGGWGGLVIERIILILS